MSRELREKLKNGVVVFDVDGVLAAYEFGQAGHYAEIWEEDFRSLTDNPYCRVNPLPALQKYIREMGTESVYVCSVAEPFEQEAKKDFVLKNYSILPEHIVFVREKQEKLGAVQRIRRECGGRQIAMVDDTVKTLDLLHEDPEILTVHISSFFD